MAQACSGVGRCRSAGLGSNAGGDSSPAPCLGEQSAAGLGGVRLFLADGDLLGGAVDLATDAFGDLLDFTAGVQEGGNLRIDRFAGFDGWSWLGLAV
ncbi:hypothetical protein D3C80_1904110 [compost metagenome]